ncbi:MAG: S8 family serine peptidase, partial [Chloroflexi bacterium]|nr:S8 family serine peptidase [Chloroflexota bacterium]
MQRSMRALIALLILPVMAGLLQFAPFGGPSQLTAGSGSAIHADVLEALQTEPEVGVIISLEGPSMPLEEATLAELIENTSARQAGVLATLGQDDFTLGHQYDVVAALVGGVTASGVAKLAGHPDVAAVHLNEEIFPLLGASVPFIHADELHALGVTGADIDLAVFDTGIDSDHLDLAGSLVQEHCVVFDQTGPAPQFCPGLPAHPAEDGHSHGSHVSGIVTSDGDNGIASPGVAPGVRIHAYKVFTDGGSFNGTLAGVLAGLDEIRLSHPFEIEFINFSFGGHVHYLAGECDPPGNPDELPFAPAVRDALALLRLEGTAAFAASGNSGFSDRMPFPACIQDVVAVGSVNNNDVVPNSSQASDDLDLLAPGVGVISTVPNGGTASKSGTSMAAPHAIGVAALLLEARPDLNATAPGLTEAQRLARIEDLTNRLKATGTWVLDSDPINPRWTQRVDARVALLLDDNADFDGDGCTNGTEFGSDEGDGGLRNPLDPWDHYDVSVPQDGVIDLPNDILGVILHFAPGGDPPYDVQFDRGPAAGPNAWNMT